jgi:hypothetical protein
MLLASATVAFHNHVPTREDFISLWRLRHNSYLNLIYLHMQRHSPIFPITVNMHKARYDLLILHLAGPLATSSGRLEPTPI